MNNDIYNKKHISNFDDSKHNKEIIEKSLPITDRITPPPSAPTPSTPISNSNNLIIKNND